MPTYFEFKVVLKGIMPPIWMQFLISSTATFDALHNAIQKSFGWTNSHLHEFRGPDGYMDVIAGMPDPVGFDDGRRIPNDRRVKVSSYFGKGMEGKKCEYIYDFGDNWRHEVELLRIDVNEEKYSRRMISGARACPPDDCGGLPGYERMVHFAETGEDIHGEGGLKEWLGNWKPDGFDLKKVKKGFDR